MAGLTDKLNRRYENDPTRREMLRRVPQYGVSVCEILLYLALPFLLAVAGAMPSVALVVMPIVLPVLFGLYRRLGIWLPLFVIIGYCSISLALNYDILTVVYAVALFVAFIGLCASSQCSGGYLACAAIACGAAILGGLCGAGVVRLAEGKPVAQIAAEYVAYERDEPVIKFLARDYYDNVKLPPNEERLNRSDAGYDDAAIKHFSDWAADEFGYYIWYYCIHYGAVIGAVGFFVSVIVGRRTACCYDAQTTEAELRLSSRALGGVRVCGEPIADMRMPRAYLWACLLPAVITAIVLWFVGGYDALTSTIMHLFVTLPSAFTFFTCMAFFASLFKGRARYVANGVLVLIGMAMVAFPLALFIGSIIGVCDCILNLRFWTKFIMED